MSFDPVSYAMGQQAGGAVPVNKPEFELIGTKTMALEEYTDTSTAQEIDTEIDISNTDWAYGIVIITCDSAITTSTEWGMTAQLLGRYTSNSRVYALSTGAFQQKGSSTLSFAAMVNVTYSNVSYGVTVLNNKSSVIVQRLCHSTGCPKIRAGNYTVAVYGLKNL